MKEQLDYFFNSNKVSIKDALIKWFDLSDEEKKKFDVTAAKICDKCKIGIVQHYCYYESIDSYKTETGYRCICCSANKSTPFGDYQIIPCDIYNRQEWNYYSVYSFEEAEPIPKEIEKLKKKNEELFEEIQKIEKNAAEKIDCLMKEKTSLIEEKKELTYNFEEKAKRLKEEEKYLNKDVEKYNKFPLKLLPRIKQKIKTIENIECEIKESSEQYDASVSVINNKIKETEKSIRDNVEIQSGGGNSIEWYRNGMKENEARIRLLSKKYNDFLNL